MIGTLCKNNINTVAEELISSENISQLPYSNDIIIIIDDG